MRDYQTGSPLPRVTATSSYSAWLEQFISVYQQLDADNLALIEQVYHPQIVFIDPMHKLSGLAELHDYFSGLYSNIVACDFIIEHAIEQADEAALYWQMRYRHPHLNGGKEIAVQGHSHLRVSDGKVIYHRDYIDLGAMLYEQLPVFGRLISWLKRRAGTR